MSYASDLRAAAEAEREVHEQAHAVTAPLATLERLLKAQNARHALTIPDRLLPLLDRLEQLERVAEAANHRTVRGEIGVCADKAFDNRPFRKFLDAIDALDREAR